MLVDGRGDRGTVLADDHVQRVAELERKVANLQLGLEAQQRIGVAIGMIAYRFTISADDAWKLLVRVSQSVNVKVRDVARVIVAAHSGILVDADAELLRGIEQLVPGLLNRAPHRSA